MFTIYTIPISSVIKAVYVHRLNLLPRIQSCYYTDTIPRSHGVSAAKREPPNCYVVLHGKNMWLWRERGGVGGRGSSLSQRGWKCISVEWVIAFTGGCLEEDYGILSSKGIFCKIKSLTSFLFYFWNFCLQLYINVEFRLCRQLMACFSCLHWVQEY